MPARFLPARFFFPSGSSVLFGGSRALPAGELVASVVGAALGAGVSVRVGCASGADQAVIEAVLAACPGGSVFSRLAVFAVGGVVGAGSPSGFWSGSAPWPLLCSVAERARVFWWAGGGFDLPLRARLLRRSLAALAGCSLAVFFSPGPGSLAVAGAAVGAGVPVLAFAPIAPAAPRGCSGAWVPAVISGFSCWSWAPVVVPAPVPAPAAQLLLF